MWSSMVNGVVANSLAGTWCALSTQVVAIGVGEDRFTSFCSRQP
jgi:hypothetical protein